MAWLGKYQLGQTVTVFLQGKDASGVVTLPDQCPQVKVYSGTTVVTEKRMPILDRYIQTGFFWYHLFLGPEFAAGPYRVVYFYHTGSYHGVDEDGFEVLPGGDAAGNVLSMYFYERPQARYIVYQCEDGSIRKGRNPTVR